MHRSTVCMRLRTGNGRPGCLQSNMQSTRGHGKRHQGLVQASVRVAHTGVGAAHGREASTFALCLWEGNAAHGVWSRWRGAA